MDEQKQLRNGIVEGTIWKEILKFFFPIMLGTLFQQLYNTVDTVVVGQFEGSAAVAAVGGSSAQIFLWAFRRARRLSCRSISADAMKRVCRTRCIPVLRSRSSAERS